MVDKTNRGSSQLLEPVALGSQTDNPHDHNTVVQILAVNDFDPLKNRLEPLKTLDDWHSNADFHNFGLILRNY
jgi:hypothetical protein